jgi:hypothetical protein
MPVYGEVATANIMGPRGSLLLHQPRTYMTLFFWCFKNPLFILKQY